MAATWTAVLRAVPALILILVTPPAYGAVVTCPGSFDDSIGPGDPTQTGRVFRTGASSVCGGTKAFPGLGSATGERGFDRYRFENAARGPACYTFTLTGADTTGLFLAAYSSFDPANPASGYLGDSGTSTATQAMGLTVSAGGSIDVVVSAINVGEGGAYTLTTSGCTAPASVVCTVGGPNPSLFGEAAILTADVAGSVGIPSGVATFLDGTLTLGSVALDATGRAILVTRGLTVGEHSIAVGYGGDERYDAALSAGARQIVDFARTSVAIASSQNPQLPGQPLTIAAIVAVLVPGNGSPTGTVSFRDGTQSLGEVTIEEGQALLTTDALVPGRHDLSASYSGDASFAASTSAAMAETVSLGTTTMLLTTTPNPAASGDPVELEATLSASTQGKTTGDVIFKDGMAVLGASPLVSGFASLMPESILPGEHVFRAYYAGDATHGAAEASVVQTMSLAPSVSELAALDNPALFGQSVTVVANVSGAPTVPTGRLALLDGTTILDSVRLDPGGNATFTVVGLALGAHSLTVAYEGDAVHAPSDAPPIAQIVGPAGASIELTSSQNPSAEGSMVVLNAAVSSSAAPLPAITDGTVTFSDGGVVIGTAVVIDGLAALPIARLARGTHSITAAYSGDPRLQASTSLPLAQTIEPDVTGVRIASSPSPSTYGRTVLLDATLSALLGVPTGRVVFLDRRAELCTVDLAFGVAHCETPTLRSGRHTITAAYLGDAQHAAASCAASLVVNRAPTTCTLNPSSTTSIVGEHAMLSAVVGAVTGVPTGSVIFFDGATTLATVAMDDAGGATLEVAAASVSVHGVQARYSGSDDFEPSVSAMVPWGVEKASTTLALVSSSNPVGAGALVSLTALISVEPPSAASPTGHVTFLEGTTVLGNAALALGSATLEISDLSAGNHDITAIYGGDADFEPSAAAGVTQSVMPDGVTMTLAAIPPSPIYGEVVTLKIAVPASGTGGVSVRDGNELLGSTALSDGSGSVATDALQAGTHAIVCELSADGGDAGDATAAALVVVRARETRATLRVNPGPWDAGQVLALHASVAPVDPVGSGDRDGGSSLVPGIVTFLDGRTVLGTVELVEGDAVWETRPTLAGRHVLSVRYDGSRNFVATASTPLILTVTAPPDAEPDGGSEAGTTDAEAEDASGVDAFDDGAPFDASVGDSDDGARTVGEPGDRDASAVVADGSNVDAVTVGGGGCSCRTGGPLPSASRVTTVASLIGLGLIVTRRRRRDGHRHGVKSGIRQT